MRMSWIIAVALLALTLVLASMELDFLAVAAFILLVVVAMAGYYKPEARSYAGAPQMHPPMAHSNAPDANDLEGGQPHAHSHQESPEKKHFHSSQTHHSEKKHSDDSQYSEKKHSANSHHSDKKHAHPALQEHPQSGSSTSHNSPEKKHSQTHNAGKGKKHGGQESESHDDAQSEDQLG